MGRWIVAAVMTLGTPGSFLPPVDGPVVRSFAPPRTAWAPGHRGVDLAAPPGTPVRSAAAGRVSFAGPVAGALHVAVTHPGGWRTSYSYLAELAVSPGQDVQAGTVVGTVAFRMAPSSHGPGHGPGVVHFGVRWHGGYVDPRPLLGLCGSPGGPGTVAATLAPTRLGESGIRTPATRR